VLKIDDLHYIVGSDEFGYEAVMVSRFVVEREVGDPDLMFIFSLSDENGERRGYYRRSTDQYFLLHRDGGGGWRCKLSSLQEMGDVSGCYVGRGR
jgi:hypothetical protein